MRSSQGAATSDLAVHRTLRVGFSPVAAAARRGAALGRRGAIHALSRPLAGGRRAGAARPSATSSPSSTLRSPCLGMFSNSQRLWTGQQREQMGSGELSPFMSTLSAKRRAAARVGGCQWNPDLDDWTRSAAAGSQLTTAIESMHQRPMPSLQVFCLFASVLQRTLAKLENAPDTAPVPQSCHSCLPHSFDHK